MLVSGKENVLMSIFTMSIFKKIFSKKRFQEAIKDPVKFYGSPKAVLDDEYLNDQDKMKILQSWEVDQIALMRAEEENLSSALSAPSPTELLGKIKKAEKILDNRLAN
jgi:hypothetical protein